MCDPALCFSFEIYDEINFITKYINYVIGLRYYDEFIFFGLMPTRDIYHYFDEYGKTNIETISIKRPHICLDILTIYNKFRFWIQDNLNMNDGFIDFNGEKTQQNLYKLTFSNWWLT
jgi:hypothetical protein